MADEELVEISGLVASGAHDDVLWAHNDSGDAPRLFALSEDGTALGTYAVEGAEAVDWEDLGVGSGPDADRSYLYVGDIGDLLGALAVVVVVAGAPSWPGGDI